MASACAGNRIEFVDCFDGQIVSGEIERRADICVLFDQLEYHVGRTCVCFQITKLCIILF